MKRYETREPDRFAPNGIGVMFHYRKSDAIKCASKSIAAGVPWLEIYDHGDNHELEILLVRWDKPTKARAAAIYNEIQNILREGNPT